VNSPAAPDLTPDVWAAEHRKQIAEWRALL
jgi:hypothetical protein